MTSGYRFQFALWPTLATCAGIAVAIMLGIWQLGRGHEKAVLQERLAEQSRGPLIALPAAEIRAEDVQWQRVEVRGRFEPRYAIFIDNRVLHGVVGYDVVMPLRIGASDRYVLVNRGWVAAAASRADLPPVSTPSGEVRVTGLATVSSKRYLELSTKVAEGNVWQNLVLERYRQAVRISIQPVVIQQDNDLGDGLKREWAPPDLGTNIHYGYAFQWFALGAALFIYYVATHVRKRPRQPD